VFFDKGVFQTKRVRFACGDDVSKVLHVGKHRQYLFRFVCGSVKILTNAVFEIFGFADIQNVLVAIHHDVHAGFVWKIG